MMRAMDRQGWVRAARVALVATAAMSMAGCVTVTDSKGNSQTLGQFIDGFRNVLPFGQQQPAQPGQAAGPGAAPASTAGTAPTQQAPAGGMESQAAAQRPSSYSAAWRAGQQVPYAKPGWDSRDDDPRLMVPAGVPGKSTDYWRAQNGCRIMEPFSVNTDVDTVYARAMRRWTFVTPEAIELSKKRYGTIVINPLWRYDRTPGAYYHMSNEPYVEGPQGEKRQLYLDVKLSKTGPNSTRAEVIYCVRALEGLWDTTLQGHQYYQAHFIDGLSKS